MNHALSRRSPGEVKGFQDKLTDLCVCVLRFLCTAQAFRKASTIRRVTKAVAHVLWDPDAIICFEKEFKRLEQAVKEEAWLDGHDLAQDTHDTISTEVNPRLLSIYKTMQDLKKSLDIADRNKLLDWVSLARVEYDHKDSSGGRTEKTCEWILKRPEYIQWKMSQEPQILWIHGIRKPASLSQSHER